jgi:hypothetical protein
MVLKPKPKEKKEDMKKLLASHHHRSMSNPYFHLKFTV